MRHGILLLFAMSCAIVAAAAQKSDERGAKTSGELDGVWRGFVVEGTGEQPEAIKWCVATPGNKRPADFETRDQQFLLILKRQAP